MTKPPPTWAFTAIVLFFVGLLLGYGIGQFV